MSDFSLQQHDAVIHDLTAILKLALHEDIGNGDISVQLLDDHPATATVITRQQGVYCGELWIAALLDTIERLAITQHKKDGEYCQETDVLLTITGNLKALLSIERTLLNGLQLLCGVATKTHQFVQAIKNTDCTILDTRKTIPGWRLAQKYAVRSGGGKNHRMGLYDAHMLKENHQLTQKSISELINEAKKRSPHLPIYVEVESLDELTHVLPHNPKHILLDNFSTPQLIEAVNIKQQHSSPCLLEASGNIDLHNVNEIAKTGVNFISIGSLTKNIKAMDLSMRVHAP